MKKLDDKNKIEENESLNNIKDILSKSISIGYSSRCGNNCKHCLSGPAFPKEIKMTLECAKDIISYAKVLDVKAITFTVGEPLLYIDDIKQLLTYCKKLDIKTGLTTNVFWASKSEEAEKTIKDLISCGLDWLRISCSRFHQEKIDINNVINAANGCIKNRLPYVISFITDFSEKDMHIEQILKSNDFFYKKEPLVYFGKACEIKQNKIYYNHKNKKCKLRFLITPDLNSYACCSAGAYFTNTNFFYLGSLKKDTLSNLYNKFKSNNIYDLIEKKGMMELARMIGLDTTKLLPLERCTVCEKIFNSRANIKKIKSFINSPHPDNVIIKKNLDIKKEIEKEIGFELKIKSNYLLKDAKKDIFSLNKIKSDKKKIKKIQNLTLTALNIDPKKEIFWSLLGSIYRLEKEFAKSIKCFFRAIEINPINIDNWVNLADSYILYGDIKTSKFIYSNCENMSSLYCKKPFKINGLSLFELIKRASNKEPNAFKILNLNNALVSITSPINKKIKKKILFINPPIEEPFIQVKNKKKMVFESSKVPTHYFNDRMFVKRTHILNVPIGLLRIANKLLNEGNKIYFLDCFASLPNFFLNSKWNFSASDEPEKELTSNYSIKYFNMGLSYSNIEQILKSLKQIDEIYVGCTFTYYNEPAHKTIEICKKIFPKTKIIFGGIYPTLAPDEAKKSKADEIFTGGYPGTEDQSINYNILGYNPGYILIKGTKGCPNKCAYCAVHKLEGNKFCFRNPKEVFEEIKKTHFKYNTNKVGIWDSNILINYDNYLKQILKSINSYNLDLSLYAPEGFDYRLINQEIANDLKKAGFDKIDLALENFDMSIAKKSLNRVNDIKKFKCTVDYLKKAGFKNQNIHVFIITGLPNQHLKNVIDNIKFVWSLGCNVVIFPFTPIPGTKLYEENYDFLKDKKLKEMHPSCHIFVDNKDIENFIELNKLNVEERSQSKHIKEIFSKELIFLFDHQFT